MVNDQIYFISMTTENALCVLQRIASVFSRHRINIEQLNVCETVNHGISHFNLVLHAYDEKIHKVIKQLAKVIEVIDIHIANQMPIVSQVQKVQKTTLKVA
ncbi:MAG: acetolactate synthase small subunit [Gammaproteobacteria bacterium]|nr:MAG: acetolactate synthase small subunit [Gammaproteobacteria bacterium]UTW41383.1 acetolactate synthase small subunit [bacterium SCSIO 12844]